MSTLSGEVCPASHSLYERGGIQSIDWQDAIWKKDKEGYERLVVDISPEEIIAYLDHFQADDIIGYAGQAFYNFTAGWLHRKFDAYVAMITGWKKPIYMSGAARQVIPLQWEKLRTFDPEDYGAIWSFEDALKTASIYQQNMDDKEGHFPVMPQTVYCDRYVAVTKAQMIWCLGNSVWDGIRADEWRNGEKMPPTGGFHLARWGYEQLRAYGFAAMTFNGRDWVVGY